MPFTFPDWNAIPGIQPSLFSQEYQFLWGPARIDLWKSIIVDASAVDSGNSPTTQLRSGLLMGQVTATGFFKQYNPAATDGTQFVQGVLSLGIDMLSSDGNTYARQNMLCLQAPVRSAYLWGLDAQAQNNMKQMGFRFDTDLTAPAAIPFKVGATKTANYTIVAADNGVIFDNAGATGTVIFTLPAIGLGYYFEFLAVANYTVEVSSAEGGNMITYNNAAASHVAFQTASQIIGGIFRIYSDAEGTAWIVDAPNANTVTVS
jgi:hypothetical protein